jgi:hypothetical protein
MEKKEITGLREIAETKNAWAKYEWQCEMAKKSHCRLPQPPGQEVWQVAEKYPVARAWLKAENFRNAANFKKAAAGEKAQERIEAGDDLNEVLAEMDGWNN